MIGQAQTGKTHLAQRLIARGAVLVGDDLVGVEAHNRTLWLRPHPKIWGLMAHKTSRAEVLLSCYPVCPSVRLDEIWLRDYASKTKDILEFFHGLTPQTHQGLVRVRQMWQSHIL